MKKFLTLGLVAVLGVALVTGCKKKEETTTETTTTTEAPAVVEETATTATSTESTDDGDDDDRDDDHDDLDRDARQQLGSDLLVRISKAPGNPGAPRLSMRLAST